MIFFGELMNFLKVVVDIDEQVIGEYPQTEGIICLNAESGRSYKNMVPFELPNFEPDLGIIKICDKSIVTDVIENPYRTTGPGLIVGQKLYELIRFSGLSGFGSYPVTLTQGNSITIGYHYLRVGETLESKGLVDFDKNSFSLKPEYPWAKGGEIALNIRNYSDLIEALKMKSSNYLSHYLYHGETLNLIDNSKIEQGLVYSQIAGTFLMSATLIQSIQAHGLTGFKISGSIEVY